MKHRPLDKYVQAGLEKSIITKCLHPKSHLDIVWTETHTDKNPWKRPKNATVSHCGFLHPQLVNEIDCTLVSLSRPKQWIANARTYPASALQAQKHFLKKRHAGSLPCLHPLILPNVCRYKQVLPVNKQSLSFRIINTVLVTSFERT